MKRAPATHANVIGASPIEGILLCRVIEHREEGHRFTARSLPGHLLHYVISGRVRQENSGRWYEFGPGTILWYHEDELVRGEALETPWVFYSINFIAPTLPPPAFDRRVFRGTRADRARFASLHEVMNDRTIGEGMRTLRMHAGLCELIARLMDRQGQAYHVDPRAALWWDVESRLRQNLAERIDRERLADLAGRSMTSLVESCKAAVGVPPMKRVKAIRLGMAHGLLERSGLNVTEVALRVGYARVHEFSRDYRKAFGRPPSADLGTQRRG